MSSKALLVSFHTLSPNLFASLEPALNQQLPLTQLTWHSLGARRQTRVIPQIQPTFTPLDHASTSQEVLPSPTTSNAANMLERPFVHMCFFSCDDPEVYRNTARPQLRAWLDRVQSGAAGSHKSEWLIVLVTPSSQLSKGKFYQRKSTVIDKLKSDFNSSSSSSGARGKDRVVALAVNPPSDDSNAPVTSNPEVWSDLITRLKESLINALEANVQSTEEDLRRLDAQRTVPGWNYCVFFERKEALAFAFESMGLIQDAIVVYDELEAGFEQSLKGVSLRQSDKHVCEVLSERIVQSTTSFSLLLGDKVQGTMHSPSSRLRRSPTRTSFNPTTSLSLTLNIISQHANSICYGR